ncbi:hypothetical protein B484DRAFT_408841 [Ochromonadaceae sp. CCMP2298]|nr:hypothetical protein B484DRAFT_408841 [Ochromonadaceae sp. CCMP2298]
MSPWSADHMVDLRNQIALRRVCRFADVSLAACSAGAESQPTEALTDLRKRLISVLLPLKDSHGISIGLTDLDALIAEAQDLLSAERGLAIVFDWLRRIIVLREQYHVHYPARNALSYQDALHFSRVLNRLVTNLNAETKTELISLEVLEAGDAVSNGSHNFSPHSYEAITGAMEVKRQLKDGIAAAEKVATAANRWVVLRVGTSLRASMRLDDVDGMFVQPDLHCKRILAKAKAEPVGVEQVGAGMV